MKYLVFIILAALTPVDLYAKGSSRGGRSSSSSSRSSSSSSKSSSSGSKSSSSSSSSSTPSKSSFSKPSSSTKQVTNSSTKTVGGKSYAKKGYVVDKDYSPSFKGGYQAPPGSTVYYRDRGFMDYLPWVFLFTQGSHREAVVVHPDGTEKVVEEEGVDGMYIFNWIMVIVLTGGIIVAIVWWVNSRSKE